ncbi:MAG TPA: hypothetical protein VN785_12240 [Candidatus Angelobacter sp.]|nr:hypothetical protein [Candidatus Angelobacter sp.]
MNLEFLKKHKYAAAGGAIALFLIIYLLMRNSSSSSGGGLAGAIASQNQGQLQMAQLNAQLSAQSEQTQAQLASQEFAAQTSAQAQQDQLAAQLAGTLIPQQFQSQLYERELTAQAQTQNELLPLEQQALAISKQGSRAQTGQNELALLLSETNPSIVYGAGSLPVQGAGTGGSGSGFSFGLGPLKLGANLGTGLFG